MEGKLFAVSIWCGVYALFLRGAKKKGYYENQWVSGVLNGLFWGTFGLLAGMLIASYRSQVEISLGYTMRFFAVGFVLGVVRGIFLARIDEKRDAMYKENLEWADTGFSAILLASIVMFFVVQAFKIPSGSMRMTFVEGDHLFVNKFLYGIRIPLSKKKLFPFRKVKTGDVVIFRFPSDDKSNVHYGKDFIKRVVALEGQSVRIVDKQVFVDGVPKKEDYIQTVDENVFPNFVSLETEEYQDWWERGDFAGTGPEVRDNFGPVVIPPKHVFVMGDNRDRSFDSRFWGPLPMDEIKGKALLKYWGPLPKEKIQENPWIRFWPLARMKFIH